METEPVQPRRRAVIALVLLTTLLAAIALARPRRANLRPDWPAQQWFRFSDGRPIALDEPAVKPAAR